jgi:uncharacterized membrane protein
LLCVTAAVALSFVTIALDRAGDHKLVGESLTGSPQAAQTYLQLIAEATVALASLVLSLTLVAVQLAMGQFSPRIVRALLSDRRSQCLIGLFLGTFAFAMLALREVDDQTGQVPGLTVLVAYVLALASVVGLVLYMHAAGQALRTAGLIDLVGDETREELERLYPPSAESPDVEPDVIAAPESGVVVRLDHDRLVATAARAGCCLELVPAVGDFVLEGAPLLRVRGEPSTPLPIGDVTRLVVLGPERTHHNEPAYGLRKLVDIAERTVSEPFDDPTTTVQALDRLHDCLRQIVVRELPDGRYCDAAGNLRLAVRTLRWEGYVRLAFDEVRLAGAGSPQVARRLMASFEDLIAVAPAERRPPLERQRELLEAAVRREFEDDADVDAALTADTQGIGSGPDVMAPAPER